MKISLTFFAILWIGISTIHAQKYTVGGRLTDANSGEDLFSAQVLVKELPGVGTSVKDYGFYSLTLEQGTYTLVFRSIGYESVEKTVVLDKYYFYNNTI